jgi:hypothetical protein
MTWWKNALILLFLAVQLLLPLRGFLRDQFESRGTFSWNMYSTHYVCWVKYTLVGDDGRGSPLDYKAYFNRPSRSSMVLNRAALPEFHAWLCSRLAGEGKLGRLFGAASCSLNDSPRVELIRRDVDVCTAEGYAVDDWRRGGR